MDNTGMEGNSNTGFSYWASRIFEVAIGLVFSVVVFFCFIGSLSLLFRDYEHNAVFAYVLSVVMMMVSAWLVWICIRLIVGAKVAGGLFGPRVLDVLAWFFLSLPVVGLFTGYIVTHTVQWVVITAAYVSVFFAFRKMARGRKAKLGETV